MVKTNHEFPSSFGRRFSRRLLINARDDRTIPAASLDGIRALTPEPKTIATVQQRQGDKPPHIAKTIRVARNWLVAQGLLDP